MNQQQFADRLRYATVPKGSDNAKLLFEPQKKVLRAINGSLNWLASQSRPDLSVQTSVLQQAFRNPAIRRLRDASNAIRRTKQHRELSI